MFGVSSGQMVLVIWSNPVDGQELQEIVNQIKSAVGDSGKVAVENSDMLLSSSHAGSRFDVALTGIMQPFTFQASISLLGEVLRILKPGGELIVRTIDPNTSQSNLRLAGFTSLSEPKPANLTDEEKKDVTVSVSELRCSKPNFEVGSSMKLSFAKAAASTKNTWNVDLNDDDVDLADPDDLLTAEDLTRPDPVSLKVCGTTGQRKACKSCVCGLKEELEGEETEQIKANQKDFKSACGSCFLGDAFRCGSCPYLGMPAFKPGEKVKLQL
ncbi:unnamed protein product [Meganyctiphanes norvegica]|uniref:Anamorsin homolog n=1 Tax=Meganyctiphanes norvegica TaxID=48144 RepID=A0AAV2RUU0_MEGNR